MIRGDRAWRRLTVAVAAGCLGLTAAVVQPALADPCSGADCNVVGDPEQAAYVGTGGLLLPAGSFTGSDQDRTDAASCPNCRWSLALMCRGDGTCTPAAQSCPGDEIRYIVLLWRPESPVWREVGLVCLGPVGPITVQDVADLLHDRVLEHVPPLQPSMQPEARTLVQLRTVFASGQPRSLGERDFNLVGFAVTLQGRATWTWDFGDGGVFNTQEPGGAWPNTDVSHTFTRPGRYAVQVSSAWRAWFTVGGFGPYPVGGDPVVQQAPSIPVDVLEARAELVAP